LGDKKGVGVCFDAARAAFNARNGRKPEFWGLRGDLKAKKSFFFEISMEVRIS